MGQWGVNGVDIVAWMEGGGQWKNRSRRGEYGTIGNLGVNIGQHKRKEGGS